MQLKRDIRVYTKIIVVVAVVFIASLVAHLWFTYQVILEDCDYKEVSVKVVDISYNTRLVKGKFFRPRTETIVMVRNGRYDM